MNITLEERTKTFDKVCRGVETKHSNPSMNGVDRNTWQRTGATEFRAPAHGGIRD